MTKTKPNSEYYEEVDILNQYLKRTNVTNNDLDLCARPRPS